ncbi:hypothetical protein [Aquimarina algicola]|uniref:Uncharacterized protein n=1 Tax=Aquimarina algicola TaxID=2589995 RepID=A0A504IXA9_9FLAO|nr:hypothetical protein [Aquimarina algicola]TPN83056.1 hypothetical protein FHK87_21785 [Aquimarina algicola]
MQKLFFLLTLLPLFALAQLDEYSVMGVPTASTLAEMNAVTAAQTGSIVYNLETNIIYVFNGTAWVSTSNNNWLINGNTGLPSTSFLGHTDDVRMEIRSNNLPLLQFGRRETLGLVQGFTDYTDRDQPMVYVNGNGSTAALQFAAAGASFYKPMFFTNSDGNFRLKGSAAGTDFFEIGSRGTSNQGELEFIIGDDGLEPFVFKRFDYRDQTLKELMRIQGSADAQNARPRVGINTGALANSTLQVNGSVAKSIITAPGGGFNLDETHHTVIINNTSTSINLPNAGQSNGRIYVLKNTTGADRTISSYRNLSNSGQNTVPANSIIWLQSDGSNWILISNQTGGGGGSTSSLTYVDKFNTSNTNLSINGFNNNGFQIPLNTARVSSGPINNLTNDQIQVTESGLYEISYTVTALKNQNNANRPTFEVVVSQNSNPINNTGAMFSLQGGNNTRRYANASRKLILNLSAFQSYGIKIRGVNSTSTINITIIGQATGMTIKKL